MPGSIILGPRIKCNQGLTEECFSRLYEWRLNLKTRAVVGKYLTGKEVALEFPVMNDKYVGLPHKYAYAQVANSPANLAGGPGIGIAKHTPVYYIWNFHSNLRNSFKIVVIVHTSVTCPNLDAIQTQWV